MFSEKVEKSQANREIKKIENKIKIPNIHIRIIKLRHQICTSVRLIEKCSKSQVSLGCKRKRKGKGNRNGNGKINSVELREERGTMAVQ